MSVTSRQAVAGVSIALALGWSVPATAAAPSDTLPPPGVPATMSGGELPTWQTNGTVWSITIVRGVTYVGGNFTAVRPPGAAPGQRQVRRWHVAAFNTRTGALLPWAPRLTSPHVRFAATPDVNCSPIGDGTYECASVWSVRASPDKKRLYVAGAFQSVNGRKHHGIAAFRLPSGRLVAKFHPQANGRVYALAPTNRGTFLGGSFRKVDGRTRTRLARVTLGGRVTRWRPRADNRVTSLALSRDGSRLVVGGMFDRLNGATRHAIGALRTAGLGKRTRWSRNTVAPEAYVTSLTAAKGLVYVTAEAVGSRTEGAQAVDPRTGITVWNDACRGASHSLAVVRGVVYVGSHAHSCQGMVDGYGEQFEGYPVGDRARYRLRAEIPTTKGTARLLHWFPENNDPNGPRALASDGRVLWVGGEFTAVGAIVAQQGLTRYAFRDSGGRNAPPRRPSAVVATAESGRRVDISWQATPDPDNRGVRYLLVRDGNTSRPIARVAAAGRPWSRPWMHHSDTAVAPGSVHSYSVVAVDGHGAASRPSTAVAVRVPRTDVAARDLPRAARAIAHYRFEEPRNATIASSRVGGRKATVGYWARLGNPGKIGRGLTLTGRPGSAVVDRSSAWGKRQATVEALFRTTTRSGGVLVSTGTSPAPGAPSARTRNLLYMSNGGRLNWGFIPDRWARGGWPVTDHRAVTTPRGYNDGAWHHVAATFERGTGARIYVDGALAARAPGLSWSRTFLGYLRIGEDSTAHFPNRPSSNAWQGSIDEVATYDHPLSNDQIRSHAARQLAR